jgi:uncharacterized protein (TIGR02246 family)
MPSRPAAVAFSLVCIALVGAVCTKADQQQTPSSQPAAQADHRAADEAAIRSLDSAWVKAVAAKNAQQAASYYTDDGVLMAPGQPMASGKDAIVKGWTGLMGLPGFALTFAPDKIVVSGDMAYEIGSYALTANNKAGKPQTSHGKYVVVWSRQADGTWKAALDAPTTTS